MSGFEVRASYNGEYGIVKEADDLLRDTVGESSFSGVGNCLHGPGRREIGWEFATFQEASESADMLRQRSADIDDLIVTFREQ